MNIQLAEQTFLNTVATLICQQTNVTFESLKGKVTFMIEKVSIFDEKASVKEMCLKFDSYIHKTTRLQTGSFYTPYALAYEMVKMSVSDYMVKNNHMSRQGGHEIFVKEKFENMPLDLLNIIKSLAVIDIACGSGVFIVCFFDYLNKIYTSNKCVLKADDILNQMSGIDIQEFPLKVLQLWCLSIGAEHSHNRFFQQDSLLDQIDSRYDIVIGNPPYIGEKGNKSLFASYKHLKGYEGRMDLSYFFIYKGFDILKENGVLTFITTNYWITADGAVKLRQYVKNETCFMRLINLDECKLFKEAKGMHNLIFSLTKNFDDLCQVQIVKKQKNFKINLLSETLYKIKHQELFTEGDNISIYDELAYGHILNKLLLFSTQKLSDLASINQGIVSGADKVTDRMLKVIPGTSTAQKGQGIFVLPGQNHHSPYAKPFYKNSDISRYFIKNDFKYQILYITTEKLDDLSWEVNHLSPFKTILENRREVLLNKRHWYALQWFREQSIFEGEKLVVPQRSTINTFAYNNTSFYSSADIYYITKGPLKRLLGILNSKVMYFWLYNRGKRKGQQLELYAKPLSDIPIPDLCENNQIKITDQVNEILDNGITKKALDCIDQILYEHYQFNADEILTIEKHYSTRRMDA